MQLYKTKEIECIQYKESSAAPKKKNNNKRYQFCAIILVEQAHHRAKRGDENGGICVSLELLDHGQEYKTKNTFILSHYLLFKQDTIYSRNPNTRSVKLN